MNYPTHPWKLFSRPLYERAIEALEQFIEQGHYKPGDQLPREQDLAKEIGISRSTLREAMGNLETQGIIMRRHGVGTFVTAPTRGYLRGGLEELESLRSLAARAGIDEKRVRWEVDTVTSTQEIAEALALETGAPVIRAQATAAEDERRFAYLNNYTPHQYVDQDDLQAYQDGTLLDYLLECEEVAISYTATNLFAVKADCQVSQILGIQEGEALLHLKEIFYSENGTPVVFALNYFLTDFFNFHIVRRVVRR